MLELFVATLMGVEFKPPVMPTLVEKPREQAIWLEHDNSRPVSGYKGLVLVDSSREHRPHKLFEYELAEGGYVIKTKKVKHVPDLRPYEVQHPIWNKIQIGFHRWSPVFQGGSAGTSAGLGGFALYKLVHPSN